MNNALIDILTFLYAAGGVITFLGFLPTISDLLNKKPSANIGTYIVWTITTLITSLYGIFILQNLIFIIVINLQLLATIVILILSIKIKYSQK